jgi:hypothetical protein
MPTPESTEARSRDEPLASGTGPGSATARETTWDEVARKLNRYGLWEFDDYQAGLSDKQARVRSVGPVFGNVT